MAKIQNISEIHLTLGFIEFDVLEKYRKNFDDSELGSLHSVVSFEYIWQKLRTYRNSVWSQRTK